MEGATRHNLAALDIHLSLREVRGIGSIRGRPLRESAYLLDDRI